jgi:hypothetical protein
MPESSKEGKVRRRGRGVDDGRGGNGHAPANANAEVKLLALLGLVGAWIPALPASQPGCAVSSGTAGRRTADDGRRIHLKIRFGS